MMRVDRLRNPEILEGFVALIGNPKDLRENDICLDDARVLRVTQLEHGYRYEVDLRLTVDDRSHDITVWMDASVQVRFYRSTELASNPDDTVTYADEQKAGIHLGKGRINVRFLDLQQGDHVLLVGDKYETVDSVYPTGILLFASGLAIETNPDRWWSVLRD